MILSRDSRNAAGNLPALSCRRRGAVLVEFALSFTIFFLVTVVGTLDFGRAIWAHNVVAHASHEAVRFAIVHGSKSSSPATTDDIRDYVEARTFLLAPGGVNVTTTWTPDNAPGSVVRVEVEHDFHPLLVGLLQETIQISSNSEMVVAN